jgi:outer membrane protein, heavy metal efflux system
MGCKFKSNLNFFLSVLLVGLVLTGCANQLPHSSFEYVSTEIKKTIGGSITPDSVYGDGQIPTGIFIDKGLTEQAAIAIALWNNVAFQADLAQLGVSRAEVLKAGLIKNPNFSLLFPIGPKQLEAWLMLPISELQVRPHRIAVAKLNANRVADNLIQNGLNLARDTQIAFTNLCQTQKALSWAKENVHLLNEISKITQARLRLGDISKLEAKQKKIDALNALELSNRLTHDEKTFRHRLRSLLGIEPEKELKLIPPPSNLNFKKDLTAFVEMALASRPDLRIAELEIESAGEQIGWEEKKIFNFIAILDANENKTEVGPGFMVDIPIMNQNEGGISRAQAQLDVAVKRYFAVREKIKLSVKESYTQYLSTRNLLELLTQKIIPEQEQKLKLSQQALDQGEISYLSNLEIQRGFIQAKLRQMEAWADLRRKTAQLGHSIGRPVELLRTQPS